MSDRGWQPRRDTPRQSSSQQQQQQQRPYHSREDIFPRRVIRPVDSWRPEDDRRELERVERQNEAEPQRDRDDERRDWADGSSQRRRRGGRGRRGQTQDGEQWVPVRPFVPHGEHRGQRDWQPAGDSHNWYAPSPARTMRENATPRSRRSPQRRVSSERSRSRSRTSSVRRSRSPSRTRSTRAHSRSRSPSRTPSRTPAEMDTGPVEHETYIPLSHDQDSPGAAPSPALLVPPPPHAYPQTHVVHGLPPKPSFTSTDIPPGPRPPPINSHSTVASASPAPSSTHQALPLPHWVNHAQSNVQARVNPRSDGGFPQQVTQPSEPESSLPPPLWLGQEAQRTRRINNQQRQQQQQQQQDAEEQRVQAPVEKRPPVEDIYIKTQMQRLLRWRKARLEVIAAAHALDIAEMELHAVNVRKELADAELERVTKDGGEKEDLVAMY